MASAATVVPRGMRARRMRAAWAAALAATLAATLLAGAACGPSGKRENLGQKQHVDGPPPADAAPPVDDKLSIGECTLLFDHIATLAEKGLPPDEWETGKAELFAERDGIIADCAGGDVARGQYDCMMKTKEFARLQDCVPAP